MATTYSVVVSSIDLEACFSSHRATNSASEVNRRSLRVSCSFGTSRIDLAKRKLEEI